jgi:hypothetical protein
MNVPSAKMIGAVWDFKLDYAKKTQFLPTVLNV